MIHRKKINDSIHIKIIKLQKEYILLARDTEISLKKFMKNFYIKNLGVSYLIKIQFYWYHVIK